jgi:1-acyl-sn-glycerol-3-phosphate acyltransferase
MPALLGLRRTVYGSPPEAPYFLVNNHITWLDFVTMNSLCDGRAVIMEEMLSMPFLGPFFKGLDPILTRRVKEEVPRVIEEVTAAIKRGDSILMAPEGVITPGRKVRRFRPSLLEAPVQCATPVHYASITYRTPPGSPPASQRVLFGPDPHYPWPGGKIPEAEYEGWGPRRTFVGHLVRLLALPWCEVVVRFAPEPITAPDCVSLAADLQRAVQDIFTPVD